MVKQKKRIGFLSYFGWARGQSYVTLGFAKMLIPDYEIFILKQGVNENLAEFKDIMENKHIHVTGYPEYNVPANIFTEWVKENKLDAVVFNEYGQWNEDVDDLPQLAKDCGARTYAYLVWEKFNEEQAKNYDRILVPTVSYERFLRKQKIRNFTYVPYSLDLAGEFPHPNKNHLNLDTNEKFTFFHPGGWGGVHARKNTEAVFQAFKQLDDETTKLIVTSQMPITALVKEAGYLDDVKGEVEIIDKELTRKELLEYYYKADAVVLPSKWETVGIPILESLGAGTPVITSNVPPMNEFIRPGINGYVTDGTMIKWEDIAIAGLNVDVTKLKINMENIRNKYLYSLLSKNSRIVAEDIYDLNKNRHYFIDFLKQDLK